MATKDMIMGGNGLAWLYDYTPPPPLDQANIANWFIDAPWAHPVWSQYLLSVITLKDLEGMPKAHRYHPDATHEVQVWALSPEHPAHPNDELVADRPLMHVLSPQNFVGQRQYASDQDALAHVHGIVRMIVQQQLSPDTDFRRDWIRLFPFHPYGGEYVTRDA